MSRGVVWAWAAAAVVAAPPLRAQEATGSIEGRIVSSGAPVPEAAITAVGPSLPGSHSATSDARGLFRLSALPVGTYHLRIAHVGHRSVAVQGVAVALGHTTSVGEIILEKTTTASLPEVVITVYERPLIDPSDMALGANIPSGTFTALPTSRGFRDTVTLAPMVNASALPGDGPNIAGGSGPETAWFVDGVNMTDVVSGATSMDLPFKFVREVQVRSGGYQAELGRSMGAAVDVVTQTGGNAWHGQLFGFYTDDHLTAMPRYPGTSTTRAAFRDYDAGVSFGGPLVRDRLWVFGAYDPTVHREKDLVSGLAAPPAGRTSHLFAGKLTWQPTPPIEPPAHRAGRPRARPGPGPGRLLELGG